MPIAPSVGKSVSITGGLQTRCFLSNVHNKKNESPILVKAAEENDDSETSPSDDDAMSEDSLLDSCSDEESSIDSEYVGYDRIRKRFERREKMLGRIVARKSHFYDETIIFHEMASRIKTLRSIRRSHDPSPSSELTMKEKLSLSRRSFGNKHEKLSTMDFSNPSWSLQSLTLLFEGRHSLEGIWVLCWYCMGHFGLFCIFEQLVDRALRKSQLGPQVFYCLLILSALFIMRMNGYLWTWLASDSYRRVKFDMHNRRVLQFWDARILALLRRPCLAQVNRIISMSAFYILLHGCAFFYNAVLASLTRIVVEMAKDFTAGHPCTHEQNSAMLNSDAPVDTSHPWISVSFLLLYVAVIVLAVAASARFGGSVLTL